jgi:hypothetical protein
VIQTYLPIQRGNVRILNLSVISAALFAAENRRKWRDLPPRFDSGARDYTRMRRWVEVGVLDWLFDALQEYRMIRMHVDCLGLDSTSVKVHPYATGALKKTNLNQSVSYAATGMPKCI